MKNSFQKITGGKCFHAINPEKRESAAKAQEKIKKVGNVLK